MRENGPFRDVAYRGLRRGGDFLGMYARGTESEGYGGST